MFQRMVLGAISPGMEPNGGDRRLVDSGRGGPHRAPTVMPGGAPCQIGPLIIPGGIATGLAPYVAPGG